MKFHRHLLALLLAGCMALAHAAPENQADGEADPIARYAAPSEEAAGDLLLQAMSLLGVAYRFGGSNPENGLDCSGFIQYIFKKSLRVNLPRTAAEMARVGREIERDELKAGDLVFFNTRGFRYSHVGLYLGNNKFIHAPRTGKNIEVVNMGQSYWVGRYNGARRVARGAQAVAESERSERPAVAASQLAASEQPAASKRSYRKAEAASVERTLSPRQAAKDKKAQAGKTRAGKEARQPDEPQAKRRKGREATTEPALRGKKGRQAERERDSSARSKKKSAGEAGADKRKSAAEKKKPRKEAPADKKHGRQRKD